MKIYLTKTVYGMTTTGEHNNIISPQKFSYGDSFFQYAPEDTAELNTASEGNTLTDVEVTDEPVTGTRGDDLLEDMEIYEIQFVSIPIPIVVPKMIRRMILMP